VRQILDKKIEGVLGDLAS